MAGKSITLGKQQVLDATVASGDSESHCEAVRVPVRALEREREALDDIWRAKIQEAVDDPRPSIPADEFFSRMRSHHETRVKAAKHRA